MGGAGWRAGGAGGGADSPRDQTMGLRVYRKEGGGEGEGEGREGEGQGKGDRIARWENLPAVCQALFTVTLCR